MTGHVPKGCTSLACHVQEAVRHVWSTLLKSEDAEYHGRTQSCPCSALLSCCAIMTAERTTPYQCRASSRKGTLFALTTTPFTASMELRRSSSLSAMVLPTGLHHCTRALPLPFLMFSSISCRRPPLRPRLAPARPLYHHVGLDPRPSRLVTSSPGNIFRGISIICTTVPDVF